MKHRLLFTLRLPKRKKKIIALRLSFIAFIVLCIFLIYTYQVLPALSDSALSYLGNEVYREINSSVLSYTEKNMDTNYISVSYREDGKVSSINADVNRINLTRAKISKDILDMLESGEIKEVSLPVGCMLDSAFLYAKGPKITFNVISSSNFVSSVESEFSESGINQTLHKMYLVFSVNIKINMPLQSVTVPIKCKYLIAETVIVGDIPDAYTNISRFFDDISESEIDDINDFGAE